MIYLGYTTESLNFLFIILNISFLNHFPNLFSDSLPANLFRACALL